MTTVVGVARFERGVAVVAIENVGCLEDISLNQSDLLARCPKLKGCVDIHIRTLTDMGGHTSFMVDSGAKVFLYKPKSKDYEMVGGSNEVVGTVIIQNDNDDSQGLVITKV